MKRMSQLFLFAALLVTCLSTIVIAGDKQSFDIKPYGYVKLDGSYDQNLTSHGNFVMWVNPRTYEGDDEQLNMTANETLLGLKMVSTGNKNIKVNGNIEFDLYASGAPENKAMLQLRHAYFSVSTGQLELIAGQTWDLISPLDPSTLNYSVLWGCGNTGYRRPQIRLSYIIPASDATSVKLSGGFFRTIGSDLTPTFTLALSETSEGSDDGTDAGIPSFQGGLDIQHKWGSKGLFRVGVSGLWGTLKAETNQGNSQTYESSGVWGHIMLAAPSGAGISGEGYTGSNLRSYFGGILQSSTIDGVRSTGGWASAWIKPGPAVKFTTGFGLDDPNDDDISSGRSLNSCLFGNVRYSIVSNVTVGFEVANWKTEYKNDETVSSLRGQTSFILNF
jgi:hypothetical protein